MFEFSIVFLESTFKNSKEKIFHQSLYQRLLMKNFFNSLATEGGGCLTPVGMFFFVFFHICQIVAGSGSYVSSSF